MAKMRANEKEVEEKYAGDRRALEESIYEACKRSMEGSDFLVSSFVQALNSYRRSSVCTPFPTALFTTAGDFKEKDFTAAAAAVQSFPALQDLVSHWSYRTTESTLGYGRAAGAGSSEPKASAGDKPAGTSSSVRTENSMSISKSHDVCTCDNAKASCCPNPACEMSLQALKLLDWILRFRHQIEFVQDPASELSGLLPLASSPWAPFRREVASEATIIPHYVLKIQHFEENVAGKVASAFEAMKAESGSILAFHGTSAENMHSILRCGLLNLSNTQLQRNGAIFGKGVYLSTDPAVAFSFSKAGDGWERSHSGPRVRYLLVCEVGAKHFYQTEALTSASRSSLERDERTAREHVKKSGNPNALPQAYILVQNSDLVKLRYIFVYIETSRLQRSIGSAVGAHDMVAENSSRKGSSPVGHVHKLGLSGAVRKIDWCKSLMILYIALLVGVGFFKSNAGKYGKGSFVQQLWPFYQ